MLSAVICMDVTLTYTTYLSYIVDNEHPVMETAFSDDSSFFQQNNTPNNKVHKEF